MAFIELQHIEKSFGKNQVVNDLSLSVEKGEFLSFLGGSGCGKTTTLRMIAGFETPTSGRILVGGQDMAGVAPNKRNLGMVFQNYALFPNMTVKKNIAFGLKIAGLSAAEMENRINEMLDLINMADFAQRYPHQLSGGQQQRVALARAIAVQPAALLLDEPLSALDAKIRLKLRDDIRAIQQKLQITTIYVTHDQEEALSISDRVAVMRGGRIEQIGKPYEIYNQPASPYVAHFIGALNRLEATVIDSAQGLVEMDGFKLYTAAALNAAPGAKVSLVLRPEALHLAAGSASANQLTGKVTAVKFLGAVVRLQLSSGTNTFFMDEFNDPRLPPPEPGQELPLFFAREALQAMDESGESLPKD